MNFRRTTAAAALVIGAMTVSVGTAHAEPAAAPAPTELKYSVKLVDKTVVTKLNGGKFELTTTEEPAADPAAQPKLTEIAQIKDAQGNLVMSLPMVYNIAGVPVPVKPVLKEDDQVLELTPDPLNAEQQAAVSAKPISAVAVKPVASPVENQRAMNEFSTQFSLATAVGGFVGTAVGAVVGTIAGVIVAGASCAVLLVCIITGIPTIVAFAGIGGILGTIAFGAPALGVAGMDLLNTLQAEPGTSKWSDANQNVPMPK
ncbi:hypothetical protein ACFVMC_25145 [Nocardia sp. NPDC127579]|uniref:hypothetical protein n=1 Tax=Nocardia sp. NPDC127579 TaxID=3345402 RepID=UPI00363C7DEA